MSLFLFSDVTANLYVFYADNGFKNGLTSEKRRNFAMRRKRSFFEDFAEAMARQNCQNWSILSCDARW